MRIPQKSGTKGSLKWIQQIVNKNPHSLSSEIISSLNLNIDSIEWLSPLEEDEHAEYRDEDFLKVLGLEEYASDLKKFWPRSGPQWDALGKSGSKYFLVEAKANIPEISSSLQAKAEKSISLIRSSLNSTRDFLNCRNGLNWEQGFYQYANRLAHLYFFREVCNLDAYLVFIYFCDDYTHIPTSRQEWKGAIQIQKKLMGVSSHKLQKYVASVFVDVSRF